MAVLRCESEGCWDSKFEAKQRDFSFAICQFSFVIGAAEQESQSKLNDK